MRILKKAAFVAATLSLGVSPALAATSASKLSLAPSARAGSVASDKNDLTGGGVIVAIVAAAAVVAGIIIVADSDDTPDSP